MKILYAASEAVPFIKTGGLADVAGSLPNAIKKKGQDVRVVLPYYSAINEEYKKDIKYLMDFEVDLGWRRQYCGIMTCELNDITYYFIDNEYYFHRNQIYGEYDDGERFIFFVKAIAILLKELDFKADIVHSNDWHTGLLSLFIKDFAIGDAFYKDMKTLYTIHNLKYQGVFPPSVLEELAGLSIDYFHEEGLKYYDKVNFMKAGIVYSHGFNTVSQTYADEIKIGYFGEDLDGVIRKHENKLAGIVNGIDYDFYNPNKDPHISQSYTIKTIEDKIKNKLHLQSMYGLPEDEEVPMIAMVTRLTQAKGVDLVLYIMNQLLDKDIQFVLLGTGDPHYEYLFRDVEARYPDKFRARIYFNEKESHQIYAATDMFLMPSQYEPCGVAQLIALRYGTLPIVRETGGLKDTVTPYNEYTGEGNGFSFTNFNGEDLLNTINYALSIYEDKKTWKQLMKSAMNSKNDWDQSSEKYIELYKSLLSF